MTTMLEPTILNNRYRLEERQATGGMATIYRAIDLMLERTVAIKILRADLSSDPEFRERFRQEAKAAANLSHPNIVTVHDFGLDQGQLFLVMEYVPGTDLKMIFKNRGPLIVSEAVPLIIQACNGIGYAHRAGIVHCDVKPQNMLVTPEQNLKVVDFGIARAFASISPDEKSAVVWGSPQYFSPEQASGIPPSPASDVYSLGIVLFEAVTGQLPFNGATPEELARQHRELPPPSPRKLNPAITPALEQVILKVLSKDPSARYRTANQMGQVLINISEQPAVINGATSRNESLLPEYTAGLSQNTSDQIARETSEKSTSSAIAGIDWITWLLVLITIIALGGLIPFWLWVYTVLNPPF